MPPRIPTKDDFSPLQKTLPLAIHFPDPPESTTTFLILFHGLGDHEAPFASFARNMSLPGVLAISVRGISPLPPFLLGDEVAATATTADDGGRPHFHWGDDLTIDHSTGDLDDDPGFEKAERLVMDRLIRETLIGKCGWEMSDILLFGFGQGGSLALGLASRLRRDGSARVVEDVTEDNNNAAALSDSSKQAEKDRFKGVVSIGGPLPQSMVSTVSSREKSKTSVLLCQLDEDKVDAVKKEFEQVRAVQWKRREVSMPRNKDEVLPLMQFFAERLRSTW